MIKNALFLIPPPPFFYHGLARAISSQQNSSDPEFLSFAESDLIWIRSAASTTGWWIGHLTCHPSVLGSFPNRSVEIICEFKEKKAPVKRPPPPPSAPKPRSTPSQRYDLIVDFCAQLCTTISTLQSEISALKQDNLTLRSLLLTSIDPPPELPSFSVDSLPPSDQLLAPLKSILSHISDSKPSKPPPHDHRPNQNLRSTFIPPHSSLPSPSSSSSSSSPSPTPALLAEIRSFPQSQTDKPRSLSELPPSTPASQSAGKLPGPLPPQLPSLPPPSGPPQLPSLPPPSTPPSVPSDPTFDIDSSSDSSSLPPSKPSPSDASLPPKPIDLAEPSDSRTPRRTSKSKNSSSSSSSSSSSVTNSTTLPSSGSKKKLSKKSRHVRHKNADGSSELVNSVDDQHSTNQPFVDSFTPPSTSEDLHPTSQTISTADTPNTTTDTATGDSLVDPAASWFIECWNCNSLICWDGVTPEVACAQCGEFSVPLAEEDVPPTQDSAPVDSQ